jgi:hypothetical protein
MRTACAGVDDLKRMLDERTKEMMETLMKGARAPGFDF